MDQHQANILSCFRKKLVKEVDPLPIIHKLVAGEILPRSCSYPGSFENRESISWKILIDKMVQHDCFFAFLELLSENGNTNLATKISMQYHRPGLCYKIGRHATSAEKGQQLYMKYKIKAHDNLLEPKQYCKIKTQKYLPCLNEYIQSSKMEMVDICIACLCAEISSHVMKYDKEMKVNKLFSEVKNLIHQASNTYSAMVSYYSHKALVLTINESFKEAEQNIKTAMGVSIHVAHSVELINLYYVQLFLLLALFGKDPSSRNRKSVLEAAEVILNVLEDETDERIYLFWKRMVLLRMIFCLLGLSYKGSPIPGAYVEKHEKDQAKYYLAEVYKIREGMEARRKISYEIAQARIAELENKQDLSMVYLKNAIAGDTMGNYGETEIVKQYSQTLEENNRQTEAHINQTNNTSEETFPKSTQYQQEISHTERQIVYEEFDGQVVKEYEIGHTMPVVKLHGHKTNPEGM